MCLTTRRISVTSNDRLRSYIEFANANTSSGVSRTSILIFSGKINKVLRVLFGSRRHLVFHSLNGCRSPYSLFVCECRKPAQALPRNLSHGVTFPLSTCYRMICPLYPPFCPQVPCLSAIFDIFCCGQACGPWQEGGFLPRLGCLHGRRRGCKKLKTIALEQGDTDLYYAVLDQLINEGYQVHFLYEW